MADQPAPLSTRDEYLAAVTTAAEAAAAYYNSDTLLLDDAAYDTLVAQIAAAEETNPHWGTSRVTGQVAAGQSSGDITHSEPMLSLDNTVDHNELDAWHTRLLAAAGTDTVEMTVEVKLDGLAVAARYNNGELTQVITRGDGTSGEDVTATATSIAGLPTNIGTNETFEVRGEVYMTDPDFDDANLNRTATGHPPFANPRNAAAGTLRSRSRDYHAQLSFAAYQVTGAPAVEHAPYDDAMTWVAEHGIATAGTVSGGYLHATTITEVLAAVNDIAERRAELGYAIDGAVIKAVDPAVRAAAGHSSRAPRWAVAYKYPTDSALTELTAIELDVGRTGVITPRAVLAPVQVGGTTITSATLHNPGEVARLDLRVGDQVWVLRAGEVIPRVTGANLDLRPDGTVPWEPPTECPRCGSRIDTDEKRWRCVRGRDCNLLASLRYWCSRDCLDIEGAGETVLTHLIDAGLVTNIADLYTLTETDLTSLPRVGDATAANLLAEIDASKQQPFHRVFCGLGIRRTGRSLSRRITATLPTMDALRDATPEQLAEIDGIGPVRAEGIAAELAELSPLIDALAAAGLNMGTEPDNNSNETAAQPFAGKTVVVSGAVPGMTRTEAREHIETLGGHSSGNVSTKTDILITGDGAGTKATKAAALGVEILNAADFAAIVAEHTQQAPTEP